MSKASGHQSAPRKPVETSKQRWDRKHQDKIRQAKREWYQRNRTSVRSQQNRHADTIRAIEKRLSQKLVGHLGTIEGISIVNSLELRCPNLKFFHAGKIAWDEKEKPMSSNMNLKHAAQRAMLSSKQASETHALATRHKNQRDALESAQSKQRGDDPREFADAMLADDAADGIGTQDPPIGA